jgi:hypothetical protein
MLILTESFKMALDFVRSANSTGEMISQLNGAGILMSRDLRAEHFLPDDSKPNRGVKLSDQRLDWNGATGKTWTPPTGGFFRIVDPNPGVETTDAQGFTINAPAAGHQLHFTAVLTGGTDANQFSALSGGATYTSRAAEIAYFLAPMGRATSVGAGGQQLYNLIRRQRLVAVTDADRSALNPAVADTEVISAAGSGVNSMTMVMNPSNRMTLAQLASGSPRYGEDIVVSNVLTFEVQADWTPGPTSPTAPRPFSTNTDAPYDFIPGGVFDTNGTPPPQSVQIKSLQILIRIYDPRMKQARQNTWKFAM